MIDLGTGNNNKINWAMSDKQEFVDIVETVGPSFLLVKGCMNMVVVAWWLWTELSDTQKCVDIVVTVSGAVVLCWLCCCHLVGGVVRCCTAACV